MHLLSSWPWRRWLLMLLLCAAGPVQALHLSARQGLEAPVPLAGHLAIQVDPTGQWHVADARAQADGFRALPATVNEGNTPGVLWVRFALDRAADAPARWLLRATPPTLDALTLYAPDGRGGFTETHLGDRVAFAQRPIAHHDLLFPLEVSETRAVYFLRLQTGSDKQIRLGLWQEQGFERHRTDDYLFIGVLIGAIVLSVGLNLIFSLWLRDSLYAHYALYLITLGALLLLTRGYAAEWWLATRPRLADQAAIVSFGLFNMVATAFMARLFEFRRHWIGAARFFQLVVVFNLVLTLLALTGWQAQVLPWLNRGSLASTLFGTVFVGYLVLVRRQFQHVTPALAFSAGALVAVYQLTLLLGLPVLKHGAPPPAALGLVSVLSHVLLLNIAVAHRTRVAERNYRAAKARVESLTHQAEQQLALKVTQRTAELAEANALLTQQIDERSRLEQQLLQSLQAKEQGLAQQHEFVSMVSHEFRTPLAVIDAAAQSLDLSRLGSDPAVQPRTAKIRRAVQRLSLLIDNILTTDRLQTAHRPLKLARTDLAALVRSQCATLAPEAAARLHVTLPEAPVIVEADRFLIEIVFLNLLHNALKYSPEGSAVHIALACGDGVAQIDVANAGEPIARLDHARLFEKYYRADRSHKVAGSGLGLFLSRETARRHGGDVRLLASDGAQTVFRWTLPVALTPDRAAALAALAG